MAVESAKLRYAVAVRNRTLVRYRSQATGDCRSKALEEQALRRPCKLLKSFKFYPN